MGSLTTVPNQGLRSFWQRPEGKLGSVVAVGAAGVVAYELIPYINLMLDGLVHMAVTGGALLAVILFFLTDNQPKRLVVNLYKVIMYRLTSLMIELDPIAQLNNSVNAMKKNVDIMDEKINEFNGAITTVRGRMDKNTKEADHNFSLAKQADKQATSESDPLVKQRDLFSKATYASHAARLLDINKDLVGMLNKLTTVYSSLCRWQNAAKFTVQNKQFQVQELTMKREALQTGMGVLRAAAKIFRGSSFENTMYDASVEYIEKDTNMQLGMLEDFNRSVADVVGGMDLENGVLQDEGLKALEAFEHNVVSSGGVDQLVTNVPQLTEGVTSDMPMGQKQVDSDYSKILR